MKNILFLGLFGLGCLVTYEVHAASGTRTGNTTLFATSSGAQTNGNCVKIDANGNHVACGFPAVDVGGVEGFQVGRSFGGPYIKNDGAADTLSIQALPAASPSTTSTNLQLYPPQQPGGGAFYIVTPKSDISGEEHLVLGVTAGVGDHYLLGQVISGTGACRDFDFVDAVPRVAMSIACGGYMVLPNNKAIHSYTSSFGDSNLIFLDSTDKTTLGFDSNVQILSSKTQFGLTTPAHVNSGQTTAPALTSCGGSPSIVGSDTAGTVQMGTTATGCVISFNVAYTNFPHCVVTWRDTPLATQTYTVSTTAITTTQSSISNNKLDYICIGPSGG